MATSDENVSLLAGWYRPAWKWYPFVVVSGLILLRLRVEVLMLPIVVAVLAVVTAGIIGLSTAVYRAVGRLYRRIANAGSVSPR